MSLDRHYNWSSSFVVSWETHSVYEYCAWATTYRLLCAVDSHQCNRSFVSFRRCGALPCSVCVLTNRRMFVDRFPWSRPKQKTNANVNALFQFFAAPVNQSMDGSQSRRTPASPTVFIHLNFHFKFIYFAGNSSAIGRLVRPVHIWTANTKNYHFYSTKSIQEWQIFHSKFAFFSLFASYASVEKYMHAHSHTLTSPVEHTSISSSLFPQREVAKPSSTLPTAECRVSARTPTKLFSAPNNERNVVLHTSREVVPSPSFVGYSKIELRFTLKLSSVVVRTNILYFMAIATCCISCLPSRIEGSWNSLAGLKFHIHACKTPSERFCCIFIGIGFECSGNSGRLLCIQTPTNIGWLTVCVCACIDQKSFLFVSFGEALPRDGCRRCRIHRCVQNTSLNLRSCRREQTRSRSTCRQWNEFSCRNTSGGRRLFVVDACVKWWERAGFTKLPVRGIELKRTKRQSCKTLFARHFRQFRCDFETNQMHTANVDSSVFVWENMNWIGSG